MPRSGWCYLIAALGLLVAVGYSENGKSQEGGGGVAKQATSHQKATPDDPLLRAIRDLPSPYPSEEKCDDTQAGNGPDLCAQWVAANAARRAADLTFWAVFWTVLSFGALFVTVICSVIATWAATKAVKVADKSSRYELRAYVACKAAFVSNLGRAPVANIEVQNFGQTPAYKFKRTIMAGVGPSEGVMELISSEHGMFEYTTLAPLAPGQSYNFVFQYHAEPWVEASKRFSGSDDYVVFGRVEYEDIFRKPRFTEFRFIRKAGYGDDGPLDVDQRGNTAD